MKENNNYIKDKSKFKSMCMCIKEFRLQALTTWLDCSIHDRLFSENKMYVAIKTIVLH